MNAKQFFFENTQRDLNSAQAGNQFDDATKAMEEATGSKTNAVATRKIIISELSEPFGSAEGKIQADMVAIRQLLWAIEAVETDENVVTVVREGDFCGKPRPVVVTLSGESVQKKAIENGFKLASFPQFAHLKLQAVEVPRPPSPDGLQQMGFEMIAPSISNGFFTSLPNVTEGLSNAFAPQMLFRNLQTSSEVYGHHPQQPIQELQQQQKPQVQPSLQQQEQEQHLHQQQQPQTDHVFGQDSSTSISANSTVHHAPVEQKFYPPLAAEFAQASYATSPQTEFSNAENQPLHNKPAEYRPTEVEGQRGGPCYEFAHLPGMPLPRTPHQLPSISPNLSQQINRNWDENATNFQRDASSTPALNHLQNVHMNVLNQPNAIYPESGMPNQLVFPGQQAAQWQQQQNLSNFPQPFPHQIIIQPHEMNLQSVNHVPPNQPQAQANLPNLPAQMLHGVESGNFQPTQPQQQSNSNDVQMQLLMVELIRSLKQLNEPKISQSKSHEENSSVSSNEELPAKKEQKSKEKVKEVLKNVQPIQPMEEKKEAKEMYNVEESSEEEPEGNDDQTISSEEEPEEKEDDERYETSEEDEETTENTNPLFHAQSEKTNSEKKVLNILVLGESGVGKSTWINSLANYMSFEALEDALNTNRPICLIASKFTFYQRNNERIAVKLEPSHGELDENESFSDKGHSSTQEPKAYQFETAKYIIRIIDTPGIGDTRGVEQDKENTRKILGAIGQYAELHAICFLFKSNEPRLTVSFTHCISELLLQLHRNAINNMAFFFTNARSTFFKPGETMRPLQAFLDKLRNDRGLEIPFEYENSFCIDNEAFRLVCAHFNGAKVGENDFKKFAESWKRSAAESHRFIEFVAAQRPHHVSDMLSINHARTVIYILAGPLATVNELIESNIVVYKHRKEALQKTNDSLAELQAKGQISRITIVAKPLDHPKTVCTEPECTERIMLPDSEQYQTIYSQVCHDRCQLSNVDVERVPEPNLKNCSAMDPEKNCKECGCKWNKHMHIRFEQRKETIVIEDETMKKLIEEKKSASEVKVAMINECETMVEELKEEQQKIVKTSLRFGGFLQENAIIAYNDAFEKYVEQSISEEEHCVDFGGDRSKLDNLKKILNDYKQEKAMMIKAQKNPSEHGGQSIAPDEIELLKDKLFNLKHMGQALKDLFTATENGLAQQRAHAIVKYTPPKKVEPVQYGKFKPSNKTLNQSRPAEQKKPSTSKAKEPNTQMKTKKEKK